MPKYLLDSNFFINAHRAWYPFDVVASFWVRVQELAEDGVIASIDSAKTGNSGSDKRSFKS